VQLRLLGSLRWCDAAVALHNQSSVWTHSAVSVSSRPCLLSNCLSVWLCLPPTHKERDEPAWPLSFCFSSLLLLARVYWVSRFRLINLIINLWAAQSSLVQQLTEQCLNSSVARLNQSNQAQESTLHVCEGRHSVYVVRLTGVEQKQQSAGLYGARMHFTSQIFSISLWHIGGNLDWTLF